MTIDLGSRTVRLDLPPGADVLAMGPCAPVEDPAAAIARSLDGPIGCPGLEQVAAANLHRDPHARTVIVVSDHTRPVPYVGNTGILWPIVERLRRGGVPFERITVLVATGTHHPLTDEQLRRLLDPRVFAAGIAVLNHDATDTASLVPLAVPGLDESVPVDRRYLEAGIRVLTGLVESHFIAGVSGGRKAICPGLIGERATYRFHGAEMLSDPAVRDMNLDGNPAHRYALAVAKAAGADFIVNVTLDRAFRITGVFSGHLEAAHRAAFEHLRGYVAIPCEREYDIVVTHGGRVGVNHYQAVKAGLAALPAIRDGGTLVIVAANSDTDPVGSLRYRSLLHLLKLVGPAAFLRLVASPDWTFVPEQWEVQAWARVLERTTPRRLVYFAPECGERDASIIPGIDGNRYLPPDRRYRADGEAIAEVVRGAVTEASARIEREEGRTPVIAALADGPYGIVTPLRSLP